MVLVFLISLYCILWSLLQIIKEIDQAYEKAADVGFYSWYEEVQVFDRLLEALPDRAWIE